MNGLTLVIIGACVYALAYRFYGAFIAAKVLAFDSSRTTPAYRLENGYDYVPTNKLVLFGHHLQPSLEPGRCRAGAGGSIWLSPRGTLDLNWGSGSGRSS